MSSDKCGAQTRSGDPCANPPMKGAERCRHHGGKSTGPKTEEGIESIKGNAETHGMTADAEKWFKRHREDVEDDVKEMVTAWMENAPFGWDNTGNVRLLLRAAINECQMAQGDRYIRENGFITEETRSSGESIYAVDTENPAFLAKSRLQKDTIRILKELGVLNDPDTKQAEANIELGKMIGEALQED